MKMKSCGIFLLLVACWLSIAADPLYSTEQLRVAYPALAPGSSPLWVPLEKGIWKKHGLDVELILLTGGGRAIPALLSNSIQVLVGSDTGVIQAIAQGADVVRLGVTMNSLGNSLLTNPGIRSVQELKGKVLGIGLGRDASYARLAKLLRDSGLNPTSDVKFLPIGGGQGARLSALKAGVIHGTMLFPPLDLVATKEGLKVLQKLDVPTIGGGINVTAPFLRHNRKALVNFLRGYMEGIHYMITHKQESLEVFAKYFQNPDLTTMAYLYGDVIGRVERSLQPNFESVRFLIDIVAQDSPKAKQLSERDHWDLSLTEEIRRSGFIDQLYKR
jgi:NitT/TauT family transport system substrate-binding protein